ncbi:Global transcription regulator sge1 [Microbotryomycetes sp. JL201]|nr:Global transcription regulator sge1 [Microbotryomycetes sp. JL201]
MAGLAEPAFQGFVETTLDALLIFEGCRRGILPKITRRLQEPEKRALVDSGSVFVFDEEETGIKRWTDGLIWSPSRTLGNFLLYRELVKKSTKEAKTDGAGSANSSSAEEPVASTSEVSVPFASSSRSNDSRRRSFSEASGSTQLDRARERALVGSLTSSTRFRSDGLVKKTISLAGVHMICYYRIEDVTSGRLRTPSSHPELMSMEISPDMLAPSLFRVPPVIEIGLDGQVRYKAESDTPLSPNTRPGSSSDFPAMLQPTISVRAAWPTTSVFDAAAPLNRPAQDHPAMYGPVEHDPYATQDGYVREVYPAPPGSSGGIFSFQPPPPNRGGPAVSSGPTNSQALYASALPTTSPTYGGHQASGHHYVGDGNTASGHVFSNPFAGPGQPIYHHSHPPATAPAQYHQQPRHPSMSGPSLAFRPASSTSLYEGTEYEYDNSPQSVVYSNKIQPYAAPTPTRVYGNYVSQSPAYRSSAEPPRSVRDSGHARHPSHPSHPSGLVGSAATVEELDVTGLASNDASLTASLPEGSSRPYPASSQGLESYVNQPPAPLGFAHSVGVDSAGYGAVKNAQGTRTWWTPPPTTATATTTAAQRGPASVANESFADPASPQ